MNQDFEETCIINALADLDALVSSDARFDRNEHAQEAERHLRLLLAELSNLRAQEHVRKINREFEMERITE